MIVKLQDGMDYKTNSKINLPIFSRSSFRLDNLVSFFRDEESI